MIGTVIDTQDVDPSLVFRSTINTFNDNNVSNFLKENMNNFYNKMLTNGTTFATKVKSIYGNMTDNTMLMKAKSILSNSDKLLKDDIIQIKTRDTIFSSGTTNRQYIMAQPRLFEMYRNNRIDGWNDIWSNNEPYIEPTHRVDYQNVMDGSGIFTDTGMIVHHYSNDSEVELTLEEKYIVRNLWDIAMGLVDEGIDPTNENKNSKL